LGASRLLWSAIAAAVVARLLLLAVFPLLDPSESRYAEIARQMLATGDWVTPWLAPGEPFWGKPPLSFWVTAASLKLFGIGEVAARLPHFVGGCLIAWLAWSWQAQRSKREAAYAIALLAGSALFFLMSGTVMTDLSLALGLMLVMRGFWLAVNGPLDGREREQLLMFLGLAIGLLAKGPIALMAAAPLAIWTFSTGKSRRVLGEIRWLPGILLVIAVVAPWYAWAEARTPGFLEYFIVGEHWQRFVNSDWQGDLYGHAHAFPRGTIWLFTLLALFPWSLLLPLAAWRRRRTGFAIAAEDRKLTLYLLLWALTPCAVFTLSGNILWTYVLPAVPAASMLAAIWLNGWPDQEPANRLLAAGVAITTVGSVALVAAYHLTGWDERRSTKSVIAEYEVHRIDRAGLVFFRDLPHSGAFYSGGAAEIAVEPRDLEARLEKGPAFVVVRSRHRARLSEALTDELRLVRQRGEYGLYFGDSTRYSLPHDPLDRLADACLDSGARGGAGSRPRQCDPD
jgi:4-amino-4-deoxy-L-arabinose transferase-like glycosyltransferase